MSTFYKETVNFNDMNEVKALYEELLNENIASAAHLEDWLVKYSKVQEEIEEGLSGHYIDFQCFSESEKAKEQFEYDQQRIEPLRKNYTAKLDNKFLSSPFINELDKKEYGLLIKSKRNAQELFREENVQLEIEEDKLTTAYFEITGSLTADWDGTEMSLSELSPYLESEDRHLRESAMKKMFTAFEEKSEDLQQIMSELILLRNEKAKNAGLENYRDYMFKEYERFDYTPGDCYTLAQAVKKHVTPLKESIQKLHKKELQVEEYMPWDRRGTPPDNKSLQPFQSRNELVDKSAIIFNNLDKRFAELLDTMDKKGMLDLTARKGKAPGGFCTYLPVSGLSFIFMNASQTHDDMITLLHEMGHCIHNDFTQHFKIAAYKNTPMESAELASMTMELLTMDQWDHFYPDKNALVQAKRDQLRGIVDFLPLGIIIDQFQHWMYENPTHSAAERLAKFAELQQSFDSSVVNWEGFESWQERSWLRILHIFEVPFYFIEYVIAQLGALQIYKNYLKNPEKTLKNYTEALKLGSSVPLSEVYKTAGIQFDFSEEMIKDLMEFVQEELSKLERE
ncbi:M3 family oligoendopeptidase [Alkalicoccus daliensis]|uniref:Oligoendopeptidase F n=1 Tax=Alkalicoccus daliensis TaxID=745820 RepID=A0A1H0IB79_9BACI|nr:M3 family oligoendopeptidase [Alkalicoccus daliensis]SDO28351.1 oligoendopeptidase F [Alkalicoccus daliensis]